MPLPDEDTLNRAVTGADSTKPGRQPDRSLGDQSTRGDSGSSVSDLPGAFDGADDGMEVVDLSSRYEIQGTLGRGGMGDVVLAYDNRIKRQVAIKRILGEMADNRRAVRRFLTEAQSVGALSHPNIVQVFEFGRDREGSFLILEYVSGGTLLQKLESGPLPIAEAVRIASQVLDGLAVAHEQGIIHRDIKPNNILLTSRGDPKLTDFGLARHEERDSGLTTAGAVLGTLDYMPPEQRKDAALVDSRSDLWSLAATLYQMLTGDPPRVIDLDALPQQLRPVLTTALKPRKEDRYQSAVEFRDALLATDIRQKLNTEDLKQGECPNCHATNPTDQKYCTECGKNLVEPCLACHSSVSVWQKFCGSCGKGVADCVDAYRETLRQQASEIRNLSQTYRYDEALVMLEKISAITDHRFQEFVDWAQPLHQSIKEDSFRKREETASLFKAANEAVTRCQFKEAARFLGQIPERLRDEPTRQLHDTIQTRLERLKSLSTEINTAVKARQYNGLLPKLEEYLILKPTDANARQMVGKLRAKASQQAELNSDNLILPSREFPSKNKNRYRTQPTPLTKILIAAGCVVLVVIVYVSTRSHEAMPPRNSTQPTAEVRTTAAAKATGSIQKNDIMASSQPGKSTNAAPSQPSENTTELLAEKQDSPSEILQTVDRKSSDMSGSELDSESLKVRTEDIRLSADEDVAQTQANPDSHWKFWDTFRKGANLNQSLVLESDGVLKWLADPKGGVLTTVNEFSELVLSLEFMFPSRIPGNAFVAVASSEPNPDGGEWTKQFPFGIEVKLNPDNAGQICLPPNNEEAVLSKGRTRDPQDNRKINPMPKSVVPYSKWNRLEVVCNRNRKVIAKINGVVVNEIEQVKNIHGHVVIWPGTSQMRVRNVTIESEGKMTRLSFARITQ